MLPRVKIFFENGALGQVAPMPDGVLGLMATGVAVPSDFELNKAYVLKSFADLEALGVTTGNNPHIYKIVKDFYKEAGDGTELWLAAYPDTVKVSEMVDKDEDYYKTLIDTANGRIRGLIVSRKPGGGYSPSVTDGLDGDIYTAMANAQLLAEKITNEKYAPIFVALEGYDFSGDHTELADLHLKEYNRVCCLIGDTTSGSKHAALGLLAGRIASNPVQRNIGRVRDGAVQAEEMFIDADAVEQYDTESIHDKGFITFRTFVGRSGYFFTDDWMATAIDDDYNHLTARRTIDKAYRVAYEALLPILLDEIPVTAEGTIQAPLAKAWENVVESAIVANMTANGELSSDALNDDPGVECVIDTTNNVISSGRVNVQLRVRPFAYPRYVDVYLGFQTIGN